MPIKNSPDFWLKAFPFKTGDLHKYDYGSALIYGAPALTGATRLAAQACARIGAGLVTVLAPDCVANVYRETLPAHIMVRDDLDWFDSRVSALLYGPGGLPCDIVIRDDLPMVMDADAVGNLPDGLHDKVVLTPHEGEFFRAFPDLTGDDKALQAAQRSGALVVLKGAHTIIAHPDGRVVVNDHASPYLATAGSGDVLAGMVTGLLAQGMEPFMAASAAVWIHGECALRFGPGLVASDLVEFIPNILTDFA